MRPRIFISHSAKEASAGAFLDALERRLVERGFDVLLDRTRLSAGDDWFGCISNWVEYCHGAIVLFSPAALRSEFVFFEVSNLFHRWSREQPAFPLLPVRLGGVTGDALGDGRYGAIQLAAKVQHVEGSDVDATLAALAPKLDALRTHVGLPESPFEKLEAQIVTLVDGCSWKVRRAAADAMRIATDDWTESSASASLARALMLTDFSGVFKAARELRRGLDFARVRELFDLLAPNWVSRRAALELQERATRKTGRAAVVTGREVLFTPDMYARRAAAHLPGWGWEVAVVSAKVGAEERCNLVEQVRASLRERLGLLEDDGEDELPRALRRRERDGDPVVVGLALDDTLLPAVPALERRFPTVTFLVLHEAGAPASWTLRPELPVERERWAKDEYDDYLRRLERAS